MFCGMFVEYCARPQKRCYLSCACTWMLGRSRQHTHTRAWLMLPGLNCSVMTAPWPRRCPEGCVWVRSAANNRHAVFF